MPKKPTYQHRWGLDPTPIDPVEIEAAVNVPGGLGIKLNDEQKKRWGEIVSYLAWRLKLGEEPRQTAVDQMLTEINAGIEKILPAIKTIDQLFKKIQTGVDQVLPALETIQNPMIKRELAIKADDVKKVLPSHLKALNISGLIASLKEWKQTCRVELTHRKKRHKKGRPSDSNLDTAILNIGKFYREATGKRPTVYRTQHSQKGKAPVAGKLFRGEFLEITFETLLALNVPSVRESARNALAERIERLKSDLVA
jgi:hypothetical protein